MKLKIVFEFKDGPWGGGNQFLKALKSECEKKGIYTEDDEEADAFLINSINAFADYDNIFFLRKKYPEKVFIHRVDGPVFLIRGKDKNIDKGIFAINDLLADATIYQTQWSKEKCVQLGMKDNKPSVIICNGCNSDIFYPIMKEKNEKRKIKIIATSWSNNWKKGFQYYKYLDEHLNMNKYEFLFVGNSPINFRNSILHEPVKSEELGDLLRCADVYITASQNDPCSNSLIEALGCGLPAVVLNDGGHPYIVSSGGETFSTPEEMLEKIEKVSNNLDYYKDRVPNRDIKNVAQEYIDFISYMVDEKKRGEIKKEKYGLLKYLCIMRHSPRKGFIRILKIMRRK